MTLPQGQPEAAGGQWAQLRRDDPTQEEGRWALHSLYMQSVYPRNGKKFSFPKYVELTCKEHFVLFFGFVSVWGMGVLS